MDLELKEKKVLITGSSRGIGKALALRFLEEGSSVAITSRNESDLTLLEEFLKNKYGTSRVLAFKSNCSETNSLKALKESIFKEWNNIDVVIANAGSGNSVSDPLPSEENWSRVWKNNFDTALNTSRVFLPTLIKSKGCFLFISSIAGLEAFGAPVDYSTSKTAIIALAKNMSRKLSKEVRINTLAPGNIFFEDGSWDEKLREDPERIKMIIDNTVPMQRFGTLDEVSDAALFLCSNRASFISGCTLVVDGGQTVSVL